MHAILNKALTNKSAYRALVPCAVALILLNLVGLYIARPVPGRIGIGYGGALSQFIALTCVQGAVYLAAVAVLLWRRPAPSLLFIIGIAIILRLIVVDVPPFLSTDIYRYIWDGWVQAAGINPYRYIPDDAHLAFLRDAAVFPHINRANYAPTIYPPAAQIGFLASSALVRLLHLPAVLGMKLAILGFEAAAMWAMLLVLDTARLPRTRILIYAWNPVAVWEFAGSGHVDAIAICAIAFALLAACRAQNGLAGGLLGLAVLTKFLPIVLAPALWCRRDWKFPAALCGTIIVLYLPYLGVGRAVLGFLGGYTAQEGLNSGQGVYVLALLALVTPIPPLATKLYLAALGLLLCGTGLIIVWRQREVKTGPAFTRQICAAALLLGFLLMAGLGPHYPWYYLFLLLPACVVPAPAALYLVTSSTLLYLNPTHTNPFWPTIIFIPAALLALGQLLSVRPAIFPAHTGASP
jgi:alpha-1,6-mannosyltransferase